MEVVASAASISQLIDATLKTIKYLNKVKHTSEGRSRLTREVTLLLTLLGSLDSQVTRASNSEPWFDCVRSLAVENGPIDQLRLALEELAKRLKPTKRLKIITHAFTWPFDQAYCEHLLGKIERVKSSVSLALQGDT
ncbi:MAG: hypothetical protein LQ344_003070, partial [Seirophora lacunosa]